MEGSRFRVSHTCRLLCYTHSDWVRQAATRNCQGDRVDWAVLRGVMTTGKQAQCLGFRSLLSFRVKPVSANRWALMLFTSSALPEALQVFCVLSVSGRFSLFICLSSEQGLEVIESTNLKYFTKEMTAEFYALKGMFLAQINKYVCGSGRGQ